MCTFYFYLLVTFNHYTLGLNEESVRARWRAQPLAMSFSTNLLISNSRTVLVTWLKPFNKELWSLIDLKFNNYPSSSLIWLYFSIWDLTWILHYMSKIDIINLLCNSFTDIVYQRAKQIFHQQYTYIYMKTYIYIYIYTNIYIYRKIDNKVIQVEGEIYWEVDTIIFSVLLNHHQDHEGWY